MGKKCTWQRATMSKWWAKMSTSLPLPSSPHWQPNTPDTWLREPIRLVPWVVLDSATLRDAEAETEEQTMRFGRRGRIMGLRWWWRAPKKGVCGTLIGFESSASDERLMLRHWDTNRDRERERERDTRTQAQINYKESWVSLVQGIKQRGFFLSIWVWVWVWLFEAYSFFFF